MDVFSLTFPFQINCVARLRFSSCCSIFHKLGTGRNVTVHLGWWILIGSNDPADGTAVRSQWHHPSSASPWWHIDSSWAGQRLGNKTDFRWLFSKKNPNLWLGSSYEGCEFSPSASEKNIIWHWITRGLFVFCANLKMLQLPQWLIGFIFVTTKPEDSCIHTQFHSSLWASGSWACCTNIKSS